MRIIYLNSRDENSRMMTITQIAQNCTGELTDWEEVVNVLKLQYGSDSYKVDYHKWNKQEEEQLVLAFNLYGSKWKLIQKKFFPALSTLEIRNKVTEFKEKGVVTKKNDDLILCDVDCFDWEEE